MYKKIRILHITNSLGPGGKERQLIELIKNIDKNKFIIGVVTFGNNQHYSNLAKSNSTYYRELSKRPTRFEPFFSMWKCINEFNPDIIHTWDSLSTMYSWIPCNYYKVKLIDGSIRDAGAYRGWQYYYKLFFLKQASLRISNSIAGLKAYKSDGIVIYNAIDISRFHYTNDSTEFNMIMTANFNDSKDQQTFLDAAISLVNLKVVNSVYLIGGGPFQEKYENFIRKNFAQIAEQFHFTGIIRNVEEYLSKCKVGVLCSTTLYSEGVSNSVLEYMAAGLVPIVTDLGGSAEIIEEGQNGFLIHPGDSQRIVDLIQLLKNEPALSLRLSLKAKETIRTKFSLNKNIETITTIYQNICSNSFD